LGFLGPSIALSFQGGPLRKSLENWAGRDYDQRIPREGWDGVDDRSNGIDHPLRQFRDDAGFDQADDRRIGGIAAIDHLARIH
jgi:hypothetical protein